MSLERSRTRCRDPVRPLLPWRPLSRTPARALAGRRLACARPLAQRRSSPARAHSQAAAVSHRQSGGGDGAVRPSDRIERLDPSKANMRTPVVLLLCICFPINPIQNNPSLVRSARLHPGRRPDLAHAVALHRRPHGTSCSLAQQTRAAIPALLQWPHEVPVHTG